MSANLTQDLIARLAELRTLCPDMRFSQMMGTLNVLSEDMVGFGLWEIEDDQLLEVLERFRQDLARREDATVAGREAKRNDESGE